MKKNSIYLISIAFTICLLTACEKVISVDLNTSSPAIVIQGNVYDHPGPYIVKISKTVDFNEANTFPPVTNAKVSISDNAGNSETLTEIEDGTYATANLAGVVGRTYTLNVESNGKTYTASSTMPQAVNIDRIYFGKSAFNDVALTTIEFKDPQDIDNYYRVIQYVNDTLDTGIHIGNDQLSPGQTISFSLSYTTEDGENKLISGDKITLYLECIDKSIYEYFRTSRTNYGQSASPANPVSNISNGALGYFSACSIRQASIFYKK